MTSYGHAENMELWNQVCVTDPSHTKTVSQRGGYTTIDAQHQVQRATEIWGPYGKAWGVTDCEYGLIRNAAGEPVEMTMDAIFLYPGGSFPLGVDIAYRPNNDSRKKLLTNLTTKALSKLGFNADVFLGKFDDNQYVNAVAAAIATERLTASGLMAWVEQWRGEHGSSMDTKAYVRSIMSQEYPDRKSGTPLLEVQLTGVRDFLKGGKYDRVTAERITNEAVDTGDDE